MSVWKSALRLCGALVLTVAALYAFIGQPQAGAEQAQTRPGDTDEIERGKYLVTITGCHDCHSPKIMTAKGPVPDPERQFSGHPAGAKLPEIPAGLFSPDGWAGLGNSHMTAWTGPWGVSFAINLTPDVDSGIGSWTEAMFVKAMRTGKHLGEGRDVLPPMPWYNFVEASEADLKAMFAYLRTVEPVHNLVPDPIPPPGAAAPKSK